jgi:hypothetical protein
VGSDVVQQLLLGVGSSVITGGAVWMGQRMRSTARTRSVRRFLGLAGRWHGRCRIVVGRHPALPRSIHQYDVAAMLEVGSLVRGAGAEPEVLAVEEASSMPDAVEFCISGPTANSRTAAHLQRFLPGIRMLPFVRGDASSLALIATGDAEYRREPGRAEYVALARICRPDRPHLFLIVGQTGITNRAGARFLTVSLPALRRRFGDDRSFCLVLRVVEPDTYGHFEVEEAGDLTAQVAN